MFVLLFIYLLCIQFICVCKSLYYIISTITKYDLYLIGQVYLIKNKTSISVKTEVVFPLIQNTSHAKLLSKKIFIVFFFQLNF